MNHIKTYKVHLKPTRSQARRIDQWIGIGRFVYNLAKETKEYAYKSYRISITKYDMIKQLPSLKQECPWITDMDSQALQAVVERLYTSFDKFYQGGGYPKWAKKGEYKSFLCKKGAITVDQRLKLPKLGNIRFKDTFGLNSDLPIRTVSIKKEFGRYFACITTLHTPICKPECKNMIGIDLGVHHLITTSEGVHIDPSIRYMEYAAHLRVLQRKLSRQKRFGNNWKKTSKQVARLQSKVSNIRRDHLHKATTTIINENQVMVVEDLKVKNMSRSSKGTQEAPGKNVKSKSGLNRSILNSSFGNLISLLDYKASWYGRELILVDPKYTSQTCNNCGMRSPKSRNKTKYKCVHCGHSDHADVNAAKNILEKGILHGRERKAVA